MTVCFIGHKAIKKSEELLLSLKETVTALINRGASTFLFGSMSEFNGLAWETVTELKHKYPQIKRIYVRSSYKHISPSYEAHLLQSYEETYFPLKIEGAGRHSYVERNYEMIDKSDYCVFYYNKHYVAPLKKQSKHTALPRSRRQSGTKIAYNYAMKKKKAIINLCATGCEE